MNKILMVVITLFSTITNASILDEITNKAHQFTAINHMKVIERVSPGVPSPGDAFIVRGFGSFELQPNIAVTFAYDIGGAFTSFNDGRLSFTHGIPMSGVSNRLSVYLDQITGDDLAADVNNAASYLDGEKLFTMDVVSNGKLGYFTPSTLSGTDAITFKMSEDYQAFYGIEGHELQMNIESTIYLADFFNGMPSAFDFGAFQCGALTDPHNSCSYEVGKATFENVAQTPLPPSILLFLSGLGLLVTRKIRR